MSIVMVLCGCSCCAGCCLVARRGTGDTGGWSDGGPPMEILHPGMEILDTGIDILDPSIEILETGMEILDPRDGSIDYNIARPERDIRRI